MNKKTATSKHSSAKHQPATGTMMIDNLDTARVLSDPFKLKILQHFAEQPRTTKQVADLMGEKAPKLYRHVDALLQHGILELIEEKPKRGTVERYLQAVAARFEVDSSLFAPDNDDSTEALSTIRNILRSTEDEFIQALSEHADTKNKASDSTEDVDELEPIMFKMTAKGSRKQMIELRQQMLDWMEQSQQESAPDKEQEVLTHQILIAFYPMAD